MNENVTNKTPKRRRWIARLLVSALCVLLASSLLFVSVVAENVNSFSFASSGYDSTSVVGYYFDDADDVSFCVASLLSDSLVRIDLFDIDDSVPFLSLNCQLQNVSSLWAVSSNPNWIAISYLSSDGFIYASVFDYSSFLLKTDFISGNIPANRLAWFVYYKNDSIVCFHCGSESESDPLSYFLYEPNGTHSYSNRMVLIYGDSSWNIVPCVDTPAFKLSDLGFYSVNSSANSVPYVKRVIAGKFSYGSTLTNGALRPLSISGGVVSVGDSVGNYFGAGAYRNFIVSSDFLSSNSFNSSFVGSRFTVDAISFIYATSSEYVPPESSDETTEEPPPESSEPDEPGTLNIYRTDIDRSGGVMVFNSTLDTSIPSDGLESLSAYLGYYWDVDSSVQPPPSYMYLWASYEDGTRQRYDFDFSAYGYALGSDFAQNFYYPDYLGMEFEIPLNGETDIYFVTSSPGGSVTVENSDGRIITLNFGSTSSYARIDFVDELNYRITLYNNDLAIGNSLTFDQGVYRYLFVYNVDSAVNTWYYPEPGTSTLINYDKVENGLYNVVLTLNDKIPDYGKPGDFEDAVSRYEEIEGAVSSTMSETWEYLESLQEELNGSFDIVEFSEANAKLDQILSTSGGDTIFTFFKSLWGINPLLPTFAVMTVCFAGVAFIIRKI